MVTAVFFGLVPAMQAAKRDMVEPLKDSSKGVGGGFRGGRLRNTLVIVEVALSLLLLAGAGLLMRSFLVLQQVDLGLNPDNILVVRLPLPRGQYETAAAKHQFFRTLLPRLQALPGVVVATETTTLSPYGGITSDIDIPGKTHNDRWEPMVQGFVASLAVTRIAASQIWGVSPHDPLTLSIVVGVMVLVGLAACYVPARRATRVDPMMALRHE
jgi:ABC-type antimicrobial peptide transport system permease subunit